MPLPKDLKIAIIGLGYVGLPLADWINQRLKSIEVRKELTDEWEDRGIKKGGDFAILTDEITKAWTGLSTRQYKQLKSLKKENPPAPASP